MARDDALLRAYPLGEVSQVYGTDYARGITLEGLKVGADDFGPHDISANLQRDPNTAWPDLQAATPLELEIGGTQLFNGRVSETPTSEVNRQISLQGEGLQFHLDDDDLLKTFCITDMSAWVDYRTALNANLAVSTTTTIVSTDPNGCPAITVGKGVTRGAAENNGILIDLGPNPQAGGALMLAGTTSANDATSTLVASFGNTVNSMAAAGSSWNIVSPNVASWGPTTFAWGGTFRYIMLKLVSNTGGSLTPGADVFVSFQRIEIADSASRYSGATLILKAPDVILDALTHCPLLSADRSLITPDSSISFLLPSWAPTQYDTPRNVINNANAYHGYQFRVRADGRPEWRPRPSAPLITLVNGTFDDTSSGSLDQVYNRCVALATAPDGSQIYSNSVSTGNIPSRRGYTKTNVLDTNMTMTQAGLDQLTSTFLASHGRTPFKGTLTVQGYEAVAYTVGGAYVPAWELLGMVGELIHFPNMIDPDTGAKGRDGRISAVSYDHDSRTASVSIDSQRTNFEALLARMQVVASQVP